MTTTPETPCPLVAMPTTFGDIENSLVLTAPMGSGKSHAFVFLHRAMQQWFGAGEARDIRIELRMARPHTWPDSLLVDGATGKCLAAIEYKCWSGSSPDRRRSADGTTPVDTAFPPDPAHTPSLTDMLRPYQQPLRTPDRPAADRRIADIAVSTEPLGVGAASSTMPLHFKQAPAAMGMTFRLEQLKWLFDALHRFRNGIRVAFCLAPIPASVAVGCCQDVSSFVLRLVAVARRYGHRGGPDEHQAVCPPVIRRHRRGALSVQL